MTDDPETAARATSVLVIARRPGENWVGGQARDRADHRTALEPRDGDRTMIAIDHPAVGMATNGKDASIHDRLINRCRQLW